MGAVRRMNVQTVFGALRRRIALVLLFAVVVPAVAVALSLLSTKQYSASATLLFRDPALDQKLFGSSYLAPSRDSAREAATNATLVSLEAVAERTAQQVGRGFTSEDITEMVEVSAVGQSDLVSVAVTDSDPQFAADLANTFAETYIAIRREADREKIREAQLLIQRQVGALRSDEQDSPPAQSLRDRSQELDVLASLQTGNAELAQSAVPPRSPSSPDIPRNVAMGVALGVLLGVVFALLVDRLDRRLKDPTEIEAIFRRPVLAVVPESPGFSETKGAQGSVSSTEAEAFRMLRANLRYFNIDRRISSVLVTSAASGDGKSTVAWNLAAVTAAAGDKVLLLEADLRDPSLARQHGLRGSEGLSTALVGGAGPIQKMAVTAGSAIDVLVAGPVPPNPTDLIDSKRMRDVLTWAADRYDLVIVDTPPIPLVPDAIPLLREVSGVLVVARVNKNTRESVALLHEQLQNLGAPTLGLAVNGWTSRTAGYGYAYGYGENAESATRSPDDPRNGDRSESAPADLEVAGTTSRDP